MKKIFAMIIAVAMIASLAIAASATVFKKGDTLDVQKGTIVLDGRETDGEYGDYLAYVKGSELLAAQQKITAELYDFANGYMNYIGSFNGWFEDELYNEWDWAKEMEMGLKAKYDDEALYVLVTTVYPKSIKFFFNPEVNGTGNCMQFIFAAADNYTGMCVSDTYKDGTDFDMYLCPESASSVAFANYNNDPIYTEDYALDCFKAFYDGVNTFSYELKFEFEPLKITVNPGTVEFYFGAGLMVNTREDCDVAGLATINLGSVVFGAWSKPNNPDGQRCDIKDYGYGFRLLAAEDEPTEPEQPETKDEPTEPEQPETKDEPTQPKTEDKPVNPKTADVSAVMYVLATLSTIGGAIVLKRK